MWKHKNFLIMLFCASLVARLITYYFVIGRGNNAWIYPDSIHYHTVALNIAHGNGIVGADGLPYMYRLPGYPLFLAALYAVTGDSLTIALIAQAIMASIIPILVFMLALILTHDTSVAKISSVVCALHSGFLYYASMISTETLCLVMLLIFFILFFKGLSQRSRGIFFLAGLAVGCAGLIRPIGHYTLAVALIVIMIVRGLWVVKIQRCALLSTGWLLVVTPWLIRNFLLTGALFFHTLPGHHFLQYSAAYVVMESDGVSYAQARPMMLELWEEQIKKFEHQADRHANDYEKCRLAEHIAYDIMKKHPWYTCKTAALQIIKTCCSLYSAQVLLADVPEWPHYTHHTTLMTKIKRFVMPPTKNTLLAALIYWEIVCFMLLVAGLGLCFLRALYDRYLRQMLVHEMLFVGMFIVITLAYGCARLRFAVEPLLIINAVVGWLWLSRLLARKKI